MDPNIIQTRFEASIHEVNSEHLGTLVKHWNKAFGAEQAMTLQTQLKTFYTKFIADIIVQTNVMIGEYESKNDGELRETLHFETIAIVLFLCHSVNETSLSPRDVASGEDYPSICQTLAVIAAG